MASVIPQGLESFKNNSGCTDIDVKIRNDDGWNFIQALTHSTNNAKKVVDQTEEVYVHPLVKRSASKLSSKSLEMCTESLGSETGSDISSDDFITPLSEKAQLPDREFSLLTSETKRANCRAFTKNMTTCRKFPPPLTSISGLDGGVQVRPHREGGRLIIKATAVPFRHSNFQADRRDGRLRLSVVKESCVGFANAEMNKDQYMEHENEDDFSEDKECWCADMEGNVENVGVGELARPSRCKEGGRGKFINWGSFWVAIS